MGNIHFDVMLIGISRCRSKYVMIVKRHECVHNNGQCLRREEVWAVKSSPGWHSH